MTRYTDVERRLQDAIKYQMRGNLCINALWQTIFHCGADDNVIKEAITKTFGAYHEHRGKDKICFVYQVPQYCKNGAPEIHIGRDEFDLPGIGCTTAALTGDQIITAVRKVMMIRQTSNLTVQTGRSRR